MSVVQLLLRKYRVVKTKFGNIFQDFNRYEMNFSMFTAPYWARGEAVV